MKNIKKECKGITLIALAITISLMLILASVATVSGMQVVRHSKFLAFTTELKIMQTQVNELYEKWKVGENVNGKNILEIGQEISSSDTKAQSAFTGAEETDITGYRYYNQATIKELNIDDVEGEFLVNVKKRSIISYEGINYEGENYYTIQQVPDGLYNVKYEAVEKAKVGDYVNYTPNTPIAEAVTELNNDVKTYSGYSTSQTLSQDTSLKWRVLEVDNEGRPTKLISATETTGSLTLNGANGYNNAVYLLNKACKILYSGEYGEAKSLRIEDLEEHYSDAGKAIRDNWTGAIQYGQLKRYTGSNANYPKLALQENKMGIDTNTYTDAKGNIFNTIKTDGINLSDEQTVPCEGSAQADTNGITVTLTYYYTSTPSSLYETNSIYYELFHSSISNPYWLASRCVLPHSSSGICDFAVFFAYSGSVCADDVFYSNGEPRKIMHRLRPVVSLKSGVKADYAGKSEENEAYNVWNLTK